MVINQLQDTRPAVYVVVVSAVIAAAKGAPALWRYAKMLYSVAKTIERLSMLPDQIDKLAKEVRPNGGSSLRDAIDRTALTLANVQHSVDNLALRHHTRWQMAYGVPSWESGPDGKYIAVNHQLCELVKRGRDEIIGSNWKNMIHSDDAQRIFSEWNRVVSEGSDFDAPARYVTSEGEVVPVRLKAQAMHMGGSIVGWIGVVSQTERP